MINTTWIVSYKLKENASIEDFLKASKKCHDEIFVKQKGFISWEVLRDGDTWIDLMKWESAEDAQRAQTEANANPISHAYFDFIDMNTAKLQTCVVEVSY